MEKKITTKDYFHFLNSKIDLLGYKIQKEWGRERLSNIKDGRGEISEKLFETTFGVFFAVWAYKNIEFLLELEFPKILWGIVNLFLVYGIIILSNKIYLHIKIDKKIKETEEMVKIMEDDLKNGEKEVNDMEKILF